jgi:hypothetical protein
MKKQPPLAKRSVPLDRKQTVRALAGISLSHRGRRGARQATPHAGMDRRPDAEVISARALDFPHK